MKDSWISKRRHQISRLALSSLRVGLAVVSTAVGCGFLFLPGIAEDLARAGVAPSFWMLLGGAHIFGGLVLLIPRLAGEAAIALSVLVAGSALYLHAAGVGVRVAGPGSLVLALVIFEAGLQLRQRLDATAWTEMLGRYADQQDALRSDQI
jgi:uncharacterized membrane protein YphA (DoxX/SURF4 family)